MNILDEVIINVEQRYKIMEKFRLVEMFNPKLFLTNEKYFPMETFSTESVYKNILDLDDLNVS